jgi:hypothetical protein
MPNPDGTRTKDEIRTSIRSLMLGYIMDGVDPDEALTKASADVKRDIETEWAGKTAEVLHWLGVKSN